MATLAKSIDMEKVREFFEKGPIALLLAIYAAFLGWSYYEFTSAPDSELVMKEQQLQALRSENQKLSSKVKQANEFYRSLEAKRVELRGLAQQLEGMKAILNEEIDTSAFLKLVVTEAARSGLTVQSIKPSEVVKREYYSEQAFELSYKGSFENLVHFLERLSDVERIVRVENVTAKATTPSFAAFVELGGQVRVKAFRYLGTKADELGKGSAPAQGQPTKPGNTGANKPETPPRADPAKGAPR